MHARNDQHWLGFRYHTLTYAAPSRGGSSPMWGSKGLNRKTEEITRDNGIEHPTERKERYHEISLFLSFVLRRFRGKIIVLAHGWSAAVLLLTWGRKILTGKATSPPATNIACHSLPTPHILCTIISNQTRRDVRFMILRVKWNQASI